MLRSNEVTNRNFTPTSLRRGYDEREIDDFLDQVVETLRHQERGGSPGPQAPASPPAPESGGLAERAIRWLRGDPPP